MAIVAGFVVVAVVNTGIQGMGDRIDQRQLAASPAAAATADQSEFIKRFVAKYGPKFETNMIPPDAVGAFLAKHNNQPDNEAVVEFLKQYKVDPLPNYVELRGGNWFRGTRRSAGDGCSLRWSSPRRCSPS